MSDFNSDAKRKRIEMAFKVGALGLVGFVVSPFVFIAIKGMIGLLIAGGIGLGVVYMAPAWGRTFANWRLTAIKFEARKNPVETLQNLLNKKTEAAKVYHDQLVTFKAKKKGFSAQVKQYESEGIEDLPIYQEQLAQMNQLEAMKDQKYQEAMAMLDEFAKTIERTQKKWDMACAAAAMNEAAGQVGGDVFDKICQDTAMDAVQEKMNQSFAELDMAFLDAKPKVTVSPPRTALNPAAAPDPIFEAVPVAEKIKARR